MRLPKPPVSPKHKDRVAQGYLLRLHRLPYTCLGPGWEKLPRVTHDRYGPAP